MSPPCPLDRDLPCELWLEILSHLHSEAGDLARALAVCKSWASQADSVWRAACVRRWPRWAAIAAVEPDAVWRRVFELLLLREQEQRQLPDVQRIRAQQEVVTDRHRSILAEWLCEVSFDWSLESTVVFKAIGYLDNYLSGSPIQELSRFQLVGLACLRAAMGDARKPTALAEDAKHMDPQRFAYISDDTYTAEEVEQCTQVVAEQVPAALKGAPNAKMFLRSFWYRATLKEVVTGDEMHIYTLASFLLQLSLLDLGCSAYGASLRAAAALSLALSYYGKPDWPLALQAFGSYEPSDLAPCRVALAELQAATPAQQLRPLWRSHHESHGYEEYSMQWDRCLSIFGSPSAALVNCCQLRADPTASPEPTDAIAMMLD